MLKSVVIMLLFSLSAFGQDSIPPVPIIKTPPAYPEKAKELLLEAQIFLKATVSEKGSVTETSLLQAIFVYPGGRTPVESKKEISLLPAKYRSAAGTLLETADKTAKVWTFSPALISGKPEPAVIMIPFTFKLHNKPMQPNPSLKLKK